MARPAYRAGLGLVVCLAARGKMANAATASARFAGSPHTSRPVSRIVPNPSRLTSRSPPIVNAESDATPASLS
jgi:hypothetical protein